MCMAVWLYIFYLKVVPDLMLTTFEPVGTDPYSADTVSWSTDTEQIEARKTYLKSRANLKLGFKCVIVDIYL